MRSLPAALIALSRAQSGLLTTRQLAANGFRRREINRRVARGEWQCASQIVITVHSQPLDRRARLWAAALHYAPCALAGSSILELLGMPTPHDGRIHVIGPPSGRAAPMPGVVMHTSGQYERSRTNPDGVSTDVAALQALRWARTDRQGLFQVLWAMQQGHVTLERLQDLDLATPSAPGTAAMRRRLRLLDPGTHSIPEHEFATMCRQRGLPEPIRQRQRRDGQGRARFTDVEWIIEGRSLVVEIDGRHHLEPATWLEDQRRANEITLQDARVLRIPSLALHLEPDVFFDQVRRGLELLRRAA